MKNILFFQPTLNINGGIERLTTLLSRELSSEYICSFLTAYPAESTFKFSGEVFSLNEKESNFVVFKVLKMLRRAFSLKKFYGEKNIEVIIVSADGCIISALLAKVFLNQKMKIIASMQQEIGKSNFLQRILLRWLLNHATVVIGVSLGITKSLESVCKKTRIESIYNVTNVIENQTQAKDSLEYAEDITLVKPGKTFVSIGRLVHQKAQWRLLEAFAEVVKIDPDARLLILGEGPLRNFLQEKIRTLDLDKNVFLLGTRKNVYPYIALANAFVLTSFFESFGLVIIEALSIGVPVITTDCDFGPREILGVEVNKNTVYPVDTSYGFLTRMLIEGFEPLSADPSLVQACVSVLRDTKKYNKEELVRRAQVFDVSTVVPIWFRIIKETLEK